MMPSIIVFADQEKIASVISNLLTNAVKYSQKDKMISVRCVLQNDNALFSVEDKGVGIKPNDLPKIFDRFYRAEDEKTHQISGFGIGLYLSAEVIRQHNGRIWAESAPGKGSTFYFSIPVHAE